MKAIARPPADASFTDYVMAALGNLHNTAVFDATGHPALSVPCGVSDGLPIGMMLVGRHLDDATCLRAAHAFEQARGELPAPTGEALSAA
jgi:amidase